MLGARARLYRWLGFPEHDVELLEARSELTYAQWRESKRVVRQRSPVSDSKTVPVVALLLNDRLRFWGGLRRPDLARRSPLVGLAGVVGGAIGIYLAGGLTPALMGLTLVGVVWPFLWWFRRRVPVRLDRYRGQLAAIGVPAEEPDATLGWGAPVGASALSPRLPAAPPSRRRRERMRARAVAEVYPTARITDVGHLSQLSRHEWRAVARAIRHEEVLTDPRCLLAEKYELHRRIWEHKRQAGHVMVRTPLVVSIPIVATVYGAIAATTGGTTAELLCFLSFALFLLVLVHRHTRVPAQLAEHEALLTEVARVLDEAPPRGYAPRSSYAAPPPRPPPQGP